MRRNFLMILLGVLMAFTIAFQPTAANAVTTLGTFDTSTLAILPAPTLNTATPAASCDHFDQTALAVLLDNESNIADSPVDVVAWRSMPLKISGAAEANSKIDVSPATTARSAPNIESAATLASGYPNDFNASALTVTCETTAAADATSANPGRFKAMPGLAGAVVGDYTAISGGQYLQAA